MPHMEFSSLFGVLRSRLVGFGPVALGLIVFLVASAAVADSPSPTMSREAAVLAAREGRFDPAIAALAEQVRQAPADRGLLYDYLAVLSWAERDGEVARLQEGLDMENAPLFTVAAVAKSLRRLGDWDGAEKMYRLGMRRFPEDVDLQAGLVLTVTDAGRPVEALRLAEELVKHHPQAPEALMAQAYAAEAADHLFIALRSYQQILSRNLLHRDARRQQILLLHKLGAAHWARELAQRYPGTLSEEEWRQVRGSADALAVRWGSLPPVSEANRFADSDRALAQLAATMAAPECQGDAGRQCMLRARTDRLVALRDRYRMDQVVTEYQVLRQEGVNLPPYALEAVADALLYQRQPEQARDLYREIIRQDPEAYEARLGLFFALIETEDFRSAQKLVEEMAAAEPLWLHAGGMTERRANWRRLETETFSALGHFFADDFAEAERRLTAMTDEAPANPDLLRELGTVYLGRGWPRRALEVFELGLALAPEHRGLRTGHAEALLELRQFGLAGKSITALLAEYPEDRQVQRLGKLWQVRNMHELRLDVGYGDSSGDVEGDQDWNVSGMLFSRPFKDRFRLFAGIGYSWAGFPEGDGDWQRYGVGLEYASQLLEASTEVNFNAGDAGHPGLRIATLWHLNDHWSVPAVAEIFSRDTPLRAIRNGVRANAFSLGVNYRAHESRALRLNGQVMDFNDGNFRASLGLSGEQRLLTWPKHKLTAFGEVTASSNSIDDAAYFNPDSDLTLLGGLEHLWRIYRRYERSFHQRVRVSGGQYSQEGYSGDYLLGFEYAHLWEADYRFSLAYGVGRDRRVYDGDPEWRTYGFLSLNWRF